MKTIKIILLTIAQLARQVWLFPKTFVQFADNKRRDAVRNERNAERLDRIRNPSKYLGK